MNRRNALLGTSLLLPRQALGERDTQRLVMVCDHPGCRRVPDRAPRIVIPSADPFALSGNKPIRVMTTLHFCNPHAVPGAFDPHTWLTGHNKSLVEGFARRHRRAGFRPDFEHARIEWVLVTTPEYRVYLEKLGIDRMFTA